MTDDQLDRAEGGYTTLVALEQDVAAADAQRARFSARAADSTSGAGPAPACAALHSLQASGSIDCTSRHLEERRMKPLVAAVAVLVALAAVRRRSTRCGHGLSRVTPRRSSSSGSGIATAPASRRTMWRQCAGIALRPSSVKNAPSESSFVKWTSGRTPNVAEYRSGERPAYNRRRTGRSLHAEEYTVVRSWSDSRFAAG